MSLPDYNDLHRAYEQERDRELERLPKCSECDEAIQEETCFRFDDELICEKCLKANHRVWTDDYIF
jgi:formylmethanofuran dehydrogenase subunit E